MALDSGQVAGLQSTIQDGDSLRIRLLHRSRSYNAAVPVAALDSPSPPSQRCLDGWAMGDRNRDAPKLANRRLSKQKPARLASPLGSPSHFFETAVSPSPAATSRNSQAYLAGSQASLLLKQPPLQPLQLDCQPRESAINQQGPGIPKPCNLARRRNEGQLHLQISSAPHPSGLSKGFLDKDGPGSSSAASTPPISTPRSTAYSTTVPGSPCSLSSARISSDCYVSRGATPLAKLHADPVSPLNPNFLTDYEAVTSCRQPCSVDEQAAPPAKQEVSKVAYPPMRRRSLIQTPGVATRPPSVDLPRSPVNLDYPTPTASVLSEPGSRMRAPHNAELGISTQASLPQTLETIPQERSVTPCESDYQQLGGMKFGTLRITNASPAAPTWYANECDKSTIPVTRRPTNLTDGDVLSPHGRPRALPIISSGTIPAQIARTKPNEQKIRPPPSQLGYSSREKSLPKLEEPSAGPKKKRKSGFLDLKEKPCDGLPQGKGAAPPHLSTAAMPSGKKGPDVVHPVKEVLCVRNDPSAKPLREASRNVSRGSDALRKATSETDSGFLSGGSSLSSRRTLSNADSAYCSNISVQSNLRPLNETTTSSPGSFARDSPKATSSKGALSSDLAKQATTAQQPLTRPSLISKSTSSLRQLSFRARRRRPTMFCAEPTNKLVKSPPKLSHHHSDSPLSGTSTNTPSSAPKHANADPKTQRSARPLRLFGFAKKVDLSK